MPALKHTDLPGKYDQALLLAFYFYGVSLPSSSIVAGDKNDRVVVTR
jgi:hypothetical protein